MKQKKITILLTFLSIFCFSEQAFACWGPTPPHTVIGPTFACSGTTATYCGENIGPGNGITLSWTAVNGTVISTTGSCADVTWNNVTNTTGTVTVTTFFSGVPTNSGSLTVTLAADAVPTLSGPSESCRFGFSNNIFTLSPSGVGITWSVSPSSGVTLTGSNSEAILFINGGVSAGTVLTITASGSTACGSPYTASINTTVTNCGGFEMIQDPNDGPANQITVDLTEASVYPNPAAVGERLQVQVPYTGEVYTLQVFDSFGRQVKTLQASDTPLEIETQDLATGTYLIQVSNGKEFTSKQVVIQN